MHQPPDTRRYCRAIVLRSISCLQRAVVLVVTAGIAMVASACTAPTSEAGRSTTTSAPAVPLATLEPWTLPASVSRQVVVAENGSLVVLGGLATGDVSTPSVWRVDPSTGASTQLGALSEAVHDAAGTVQGSDVLVFGGGAASTVGTVQRWAGATTQIVGELPQPRSDLAAAAVGNTSYVVGGFDGITMTPDVIATDDGAGFNVVGHLAIGVRYAAVTALGGILWVVGGQLGTAESSSVGGQTDAVQRVDPRTGRTTVVGHLPVPLGHASAFVLGSRLFVAGGVSGTTHESQIFEINPATGVVTTAGTLPGPRSDAGTVVIGSTAFMVGGEATGPSAPLDTVVQVRLRPASP
jgi:hypothetical protein